MYSAMTTQADSSNSFSRFVISYFITVKNQQGSKKLFMAVARIRKRDDKLNIESKGL